MFNYDSQGAEEGTEFQIFLSRDSCQRLSPHQALCHVLRLGLWVLKSAARCDVVPIHQPRAPSTPQPAPYTHRDANRCTQTHTHTYTHRYRHKYAKIQIDTYRYIHRYTNAHKHRHTEHKHTQRYK